MPAKPSSDRQPSLGSDAPAARPLIITPDMLAPPAPADSRIDFEHGMSYAPAITLVLMLACVIVFSVEMATGALKSTEAIVAAGALHRGRVLNGEVWRLLSAVFLHGGIEHLLGNCMVLYIVGMSCEHAVGRWRTALLFLASGMGGSVLSLIMSPRPSVGASGAIFGLTGALIAFLYRHRDVFHVRDKRTLVVLAIWAAYHVAIGFTKPLVDNFAHLGGLLVGALVVLPMDRVGRAKLDRLGVFES